MDVQLTDEATLAARAEPVLKLLEGRRDQGPVRLQPTAKATRKLPRHEQCCGRLGIQH